MNIIKHLVFVVIITLFSVIVATAQNSDKKRFAVKVNNGYSITNATDKVLVVGGGYDMGNSPTTSLSLAWYATSNWSLELSVSTGKYDMSMTGGNYNEMDMYRNSMDIGSVWMSPLGLSVAYHFKQLSQTIIPYLSVGGNYMLFLNSDPGWGADAVTYQNRPAFNIAFGTDINLSSCWFVNIHVQKFFTDKSMVNVDFSKSIGWKLESQLSPNPLNLTAGLGYRF
ncbi:MAG: OmpW/AlkL family protein [Aestuariibaculum sp.]